MTPPDKTNSYEYMHENDDTMKKIKYRKQPAEYLCGQACVAMLADVTVEEVVSVMKNDKSAGKKDIL